MRITLWLFEIAKVMQVRASIKANAFTGVCPHEHVQVHRQKKAVHGNYGSNGQPKVANLWVSKTAVIGGEFLVYRNKLYIVDKYIVLFRDVLVDCTE